MNTGVVWVCGTKESNQKNDTDRAAIRLKCFMSIITTRVHYIYLCVCVCVYNTI